LSGQKVVPAWEIQDDKISPEQTAAIYEYGKMLLYRGKIKESRRALEKARSEGYASAGETLEALTW
jgi:hypothetical protein